MMSIAPGDVLWCSAASLLLTAGGILFVGLALAGARTASMDRPLQAAVAVYSLQVLAWPFVLGFRGLLPVAVLMIVWAARGMSLLPLKHRKCCHLAAWVFVGICLVSNLANWRDTHALLDEPERWADCKAAGKWINQNLPKDAPIASNFTLPAFHLVSAGARPVVLAKSPSDALKNLESPMLYYLSHQQFTPGKDIEAAAGLLKVVWTSPHGAFQILQITRSDAVNRSQTSTTASHNSKIALLPKRVLTSRHALSNVSAF
jgi:hypothetical protein